MVSEHLKTRDKYGHDALFVPSQLVPIVDFYVQHIRPVFSRCVCAPLPLSARPHILLNARLSVCGAGSAFRGKKDPKNDHSAGLFLTRSGFRYENFSAVKRLCKLLFNADVTVTLLRKLVATAAAQKLSPAEIASISAADTHSEVTVKRHYAKRDIIDNVLHAVTLINRLTGGSEVVSAGEKRTDTTKKMIAVECSDADILALFAVKRDKIAGSDSTSDDDADADDDGDHDGGDDDDDGDDNDAGPRSDATSEDLYAEGRADASHSSTEGMNRRTNR
jgi:hypothetical protein